MDRILILGAGFAGVRAALDLEKKLKGKKCEIVVINKRTAHVYRPDLYEVATAFHPKITDACMTALSETVAIPLNKIFEGKNIRVINERVMGINTKDKKIEMEEGHTIAYTYLVVALGSSVNDFGIQGLKEHGLCLKTVRDALKICCDLDSVFYARWRDNSTDPISIVIGGGGATGTELAAELKGYTDNLIKKYHFPADHVSIKIIEGGESLAAQNKEATALILKRLNSFGITVEFKAPITKVEKNQLFVDTIPHAFSIFIWTGGVKPYPLIKNSFSQCSPRGGVIVNDFLQSVEDPTIFACGDNAAITDTVTHKPAPWLAQCAVAQGALVAENISRMLNKVPMKPYVLKIKGVVIPLGEKFGILERNGKVYFGRGVWFLRRLIDLGYAMSILPWWYATKKWFAANRIFAQND